MLSMYLHKVSTQFLAWKSDQKQTLYVLYVGRLSYYMDKPDGEQA